MSRLEPAGKLPLVTRKNLRDEFEGQRDEVEKRLSETMGVQWTIQADPIAIFPYAETDYPKQRLGECIREYFEGAHRRLGERDQPERDAVNKLAWKHIMVLDVDEDSKFNYCGCMLRDGNLVVMFNPRSLAVNVSTALDRASLDQAMNEAALPEGESQISFTAKNNIRTQYEPNIDHVLKKITKLLGKEVTLIPNFEENYAKLKAESKGSRTDMIGNWNQSLGSATLAYFDGFACQLEWQKFGDDEMMQEGFFDAIDKAEVVVQIVDELTKGHYNECAIENGKLYIRTMARTWYTNTDSATANLSVLL